MDALDLLKSDHDKVKSLFEQFFALNSIKQQRVTFNQIRMELERHAHVEETVFYPAFLNFGEIKPILEQSFKDHQEVKDLIQTISNLAESEQTQMLDHVRRLRESVDHHVQEEEGKLFSLIRKTMKRAEREQLGRHMYAAKQERSLAA